MVELIRREKLKGFLHGLAEASARGTAYMEDIVCNHHGSRPESSVRRRAIGFNLSVEVVGIVAGVREIGGYETYRINCLRKSRKCHANKKTDRINCQGSMVCLTPHPPTDCSTMSAITHRDIEFKSDAGCHQPPCTTQGTSTRKTSPPSAEDGQRPSCLAEANKTRRLRSALRRPTYGVPR